MKESHKIWQPGPNARLNNGAISLLTLVGQKPRNREELLQRLGAKIKGLILDGVVNDDLMQQSLMMDDPMALQALSESLHQNLHPRTMPDLDQLPNRVADDPQLQELADRALSAPSPRLKAAELREANESLAQTTWSDLMHSLVTALS